MRELRTILILIVGGLLTYLTYRSKYQVVFFISWIWFLLILVGVLLFAWTISSDISRYREEGYIRSFSLTTLCVTFIVAVLAIEYHIRKQFNKPTLVKAYYDGDINATGIDFKVDGTYVFDNYAIGIVDYQYGTYRVNGDIIALDKRKLGDVIETGRLKIDDTRRENGKYLIQVDANGQAVDDATEFRITVDNR
jgi:ABC-type transport system involved in multi-copper enzyme maturation permease subunit